MNAQSDASLATSETAKGFFIAHSSENRALCLFSISGQDVSMSYTSSFVFVLVSLFIMEQSLEAEVESDGDD